MQTYISVKQKSLMIGQLNKSLMIDQLNILFRYGFSGVSRLRYYFTSYMQVKSAVHINIWNASFCSDSLRFGLTWNIYLWTKKKEQVKNKQILEDSSIRIRDTARR